MKYNFAVLEKNKIKYVNGILDKPKENEVLVKIDACAICTLEKRVYLGKIKFDYPFAGGHEVSGHVEAVGEKVKNLNANDKVALRLLNRCGECYYCRSGYDNQCIEAFKTKIHKGYPGPGGFSEYILIDSKSVFKMPRDLDEKVIAFSEPLACCIHSINRAKIELGDDVVIVGAGVMGLLHTILAKLRGARVTVCEISKKRLEVAQKCGADILIDCNKEEPTKKVLNLTNGRGADVVVDTAPVSETAETSIKMLGKTGRLILYSSFHPDKLVKISPNSIHYSEIIVTGSVNPSTSDFLRATRLLSSRLVDPSILISEVISFKELEYGLENSIIPENYRVIVKM
ncbi:zinc-dependent alcohol dehydrogenase [Thermohalobacter berrensis]|uniref:Sorbitol dehydrogenase n=1 Tax=Thermohalobacter berrensis TaxID=99594 RepID=A0A419T9R9_9FIRM|nr:alcohol dehydrogenase catalytic domain-containing protein [Thermohalobacter berrensis]RKD34213.1 sorbitol dehydrogenase [Thermohalobacter berrensis]